MTWGDKMEALASYAKQANDDEMMKMATRIRDRAIRRAGELLKQIEPAHGANQNIEGDASPIVQTRKQAAADAGLSPDQAKQAIRVANVPAAEFERQVESAKPPTVTKLAEQGTKPAPRPLVDLKGRDPDEFNRSLHFVGELEASNHHATCKTHAQNCAGCCSSRACARRGGKVYVFHFANVPPRARARSDPSPQFC